MAAITEESFGRYKKLLSELLTGNNKTRTLFAHSVGFENASLLPQTIGIKR